MNGSIYTYLTTFHAIANEGSIQAAARRLEIAPPSVSKSLKLLEQHIGLPLFNRTTRRLELTEAGWQLLESTQAIVQNLEQAVAQVKESASDEPSGVVRITVAHNAYTSLLRSRLGEFHRTYPKIQLEIAVQNGTVDLLKEGFDLGIRFGDKVAENMVARRVTDSLTLGLYASQHYLAEFGTPQSIADLPNHQLIGFRFSTSNRLSPLELMQNNERISVEMPVAMVANDIEVVADAVRQGVGIGRLFVDNVQASVHQAEFIPVLESHWINYPPLYLYYPQHSQKAKRIQVVIAFLTK